VLRFTDRGDDLPGRITTDAAGNFYTAAGTDQGSGFFEVLKYNSQNKLSVIRHQNQPGELGGRALGVKTDKLGNIYAVGSSSIGGLVVSFTSSGSQRWADHFNGIPVAVAVDAAGNVYTAGTAQPATSKVNSQLPNTPAAERSFGRQFMPVPSRTTFV
jgi:hypothetical protein